MTPTTPSQPLPRPPTPPTALLAQPSPTTTSTTAKPPIPPAATPVKVPAAPSRSSPPAANNPSSVKKSPPQSSTPASLPKRPRPRPRQTPSPEPQHNVPPRTVSREVFLLTGGATPAPIAPVIPTPPPGAKPLQRRRWEWRTFRNSARKDGLKLSHWTVAGSPDSDYAFARFSKRIRMVKYTEAEWDEVVKKVVPLTLEKEGEKKEDPKEGDKGTEKASNAPTHDHATRRSAPAALSGSGENASAPAVESPSRKGINHVPKQKMWTKEETDILFQLCDEFDLRFIIIHDRWPDNLKPRSVDELKDRYYSVAKALVDHRGMLDPKAKASMPVALQKHCQAINMNPFDYEYECIRKNQLEWQYRRSKAELREEEETVREARRIEANRKRLVKERQRLAKLLTPAGDVAMSVDGRRGVDQALAAAASPMPQKTFPHRKVISGAYARSSMIYTPVTQSSRISRRIDDALNELGVGTRPTPTSIVVDNFDLLRMDILAYIEWQRTVLRKEEDTHMLRTKLAKLKGEAPPPPPPGVTLSHKKRRAEEVETGSLFGGPPTKQQKTGR